MIAFYGFGGGYGHLSRISAFIATNDFSTPFKVITNNPVAEKYFSSDQILFLQDVRFDCEHLQTALQNLLVVHGFEALYVDTFPCGMLGEITPDILQNTKLHYFGRRLKWHVYEKLIRNPVPIDTAYIFETLELAHQNYIDAHAYLQESMQLRFPLKSTLPQKLKTIDGKELWLIVHTSQKEEVEVLLDQAIDMARIAQKQPAFVVLTDQIIETPENTFLFHDEQPLEWYPHAHKIFTAAGFNTWHQLSAWRDKQISIPFPRKFDDQFWRSRA